MSSTLRRTVIALTWGTIVSVSIAACASSEDVISADIINNQVDGAAGASGSGSNPGTGTGGGTSTGSCNPDFCPSPGSGTPCCVSPNGPCGLDFGNGCVSSIATDGG